MRNIYLPLLFTFVNAFALQAQTTSNKPALTHAQYNEWQNIPEKSISPNGTYIAVVVNPQEGDGNLYIKNPDAKLLRTIPRGYNGTFSNDNTTFVCRIKAPYKDIREAKIKKKKPDDLPKDSLAIYNLLTDSLIKIPKIKSYKTNDNGTTQLAYLLDKADIPTKSKTTVLPDSLTQQTALERMADSLLQKVKVAKLMGLATLQPPKKEIKPSPKPDEPIEEGTDLVLHNLANNNTKTFTLVSEYLFDKNGTTLIIETTKKNNDTTKFASVIWHHILNGAADTIFTKFNDAKNYVITENATQLAFVAETDSSSKALQKFYGLYHYTNTTSKAILQAKRGMSTISNTLTVSPDYNNTFSKDGTRLYFGLAPIRKPKDTTLQDFETAKLDIWHYQDDYLQPQQLVQLSQELKKSYTTVLHTNTKQILQLATDTTETINLANNGNANYVLATSTYNNRIAAQWQGYAAQSSFIINNSTGKVIPIMRNQKAQVALSPSGKYAYWYSYAARNYMVYNIASNTITNISKSIPTKLYDEDDDHPDDPDAYGILRWTTNDSLLLVYDKYDIWQCNPTVTTPAQKITNGRANKITTRWANTTQPDDRNVSFDRVYLFTQFNNTNKTSSVVVASLATIGKQVYSPAARTYRSFAQAKNNNNIYTYTAEAPAISTQLMWHNTVGNQITTLQTTNPQQANYNWYNTELVTWKMYDGKQSEGILYKPENFDANKKYPIIFYFYERDADDLYNYRSLAPSASTINIPYFTSNGYLVFDPNIYYKNGEPGQSAYNSVVSAAKYLSKTYKYIDSTKMGIQGQSWGGYQVAYLVTRTNIFAAAGAGAPVANMTSAYGGIRWGSGLNRQFQYEHTQSRIGATLWQRQDLYLKNSPLFYADKVKTPLLIMHNDKDGAVPWYQGIEYFTALKRLQKRAWLLQYNDEDHNLIERRNRKDLSVRLAQFFDHYLKGQPMPKWMAAGVPATDKGIDWGL